MRPDSVVGMTFIGRLADRDGRASGAVARLRTSTSSAVAPNGAAQPATFPSCGRARTSRVFWSRARGVGHQPFGLLAFARALGGRWTWLSPAAAADHDRGDCLSG